MHRAPLFCTFQPAVESAVSAMVKSSKRCSSPADPPVPLLSTIIDSIRPVTTVAINVSLATGLVAGAFQSAIFKPLWKNIVLIQRTWPITVRCPSSLFYLKFLKRSSLSNLFCLHMYRPLRASGIAAVIMSCGHHWRCLFTEKQIE